MLGIWDHNIDKHPGPYSTFNYQNHLFCRFVSTFYRRLQNQKRQQLWFAQSWKIITDIIWIYIYTHMYM